MLSIMDWATGPNFWGGLDKWFPTSTRMTTTMIMATAATGPLIFISPIVFLSFPRRRSRMTGRERQANRHHPRSVSPSLTGFLPRFPREGLGHDHERRPFGLCQ